MIIKILAEGGDMKPGPALSQKLGPAGVPINQVIQKVNEATKGFKGLKVPVELDVNTSTKEFEITVSSPPVSELVKKELGIEKGSGMQHKMQVANASIEQIISVAKTKLPTMLCKDIKSAVKTVVGTCVSLGVLIENKPATEVEKEIDGGKYDKEIQEEKTETSEDKKKELAEYFARIKEEQDKLIKQQEAAKQAETEKKEEANKKAKPEEPEKK
ncbi:MAG: 50S ribosomal protein L11 [archaeon]